MSVDDFRPSIDTAYSEVGRRSDAASEGPAFAAAVVPLRKIPPAYNNQHLSPDRLRQIDRVFYGPFFREKYGMGGDKALENGRIRYYGPVHPGSPRAENHLSPGSRGCRLIESPFESGHKEIRNAATSVAESQQLLLGQMMMNAGPHELILLRMAQFSPELWTPRIRYGSRNSSVSSCL